MGFRPKAHRPYHLGITDNSDPMDYIETIVILIVVLRQLKFRPRVSISIKIG